MMKPQFNLPLSDQCLIALLILIAIVAGCGCVINEKFIPVFFAQLFMLIGFSCLTFALSYLRRQYWSDLLRSIATIFVLSVLYITLAFSNVLFTYIADPWLAGFDQWLFWGNQPAIWLERFQSPFFVESSAWIYILFISYVNFSIFISCVGREAQERRAFLNGLTVLCSLTYLAYLFLPSHGPLVYFATDYHFSLSGGSMYHYLEQLNAKTGGNHGAFWSISIAAAIYCSLFDIKISPLRGWIYLLFVGLIAMASLILRYHYVVDLIIGATVGFLARRIAFATRNKAI